MYPVTPVSLAYEHFNVFRKPENPNGEETLVSESQATEKHTGLLVKMFTLHQAGQGLLCDNTYSCIDKKKLYC